MPKDNDSLLNDILNETESKKSESAENTDDSQEAEKFIEQSLKSSEFRLRSAETVGDDFQEDSGEDPKENLPEYDENIPEKKSPEKKKRKKKKKHHYRLPGVLILITLIFAVAISLSLVIIAYGKDMLGIGKSEATQIIVVPEGATTEEISLMLEKDGVIKSPEFFQLFSRLSKSDDQYIAGEHFVRPNMAYETLIRELTSIQSEEKVEVSVTFPEGITLVDAANKLEAANVCSASDFIFYFNSGNYGFDFESHLSSSTTLKFYRMEGYLFPDTYYFYENMDPEQVCQKIYLNFNEKMTDERYEKMESLGLTLDQLITFSSIVQAEAPTMESMIMVASVFWNRLNNPDAFPLLQSDPTTYYARDVIKPNMEIEDELILNAYDTYKSPGLPPGPICNPGIEAIDAVLKNFQSNYYFFYANVVTGEIRYAETLEEHEQNAYEIQQDIAEAEGGE